jgi:divalent metal cation (Fe/Co/Zn/Cd) transporter
MLRFPHAHRSINALHKALAYRRCSYLPCLAIFYKAASTSTSAEKGRAIKGVLKGTKKPDNRPHMQMPMAQGESKHAEYEKVAISITKAGALANVLLAGCKGVTGYMVGSTALIADAINSLSDLLCDGVVYLSVTEARKAATPDNPWGRGKLEPLGEKRVKNFLLSKLTKWLGSLMVSGLLLGTGIGIAYSASLVSLQTLVANFFHDSQPQLVHEILHFMSLDGYLIHGDMPRIGVELPIDGFAHGVALGVSSVSIVVKELLYRYTL